MKLFALMMTLLTASAAAAAEGEQIRPPAVPLVAHDPYFSVWSPASQLTDGWTEHWTGQTNGAAGLVRVDGKPYRFLGLPHGLTDGPELAVAEQTSLKVLPTRTIYTFKAGEVELTVRFLTPSLPDDLDVLSRPVTYVDVTATSADGKSHDVQVYLDLSGEWTVNTPDQQVTWDRPEIDGLTALRMGSEAQPVLGRTGDGLRIEWGHLFLASPDENVTTTAVAAGHEAARGSFVRNGKLSGNDDTSKPRPAGENWPVIALAQDLGKVSDDAKTATFLIAYDDEWSIEHMGEWLRPWWKRDGMSSAEMLQKAADQHEELIERSIAFDEALMADLRKAGGEKYAQACALAYRQCLAAHKLVAAKDGKTPLYFSKENYSNGCIATVDVTYPSSPMFLLLNPTLLKGMTTPILDYAQTDRWKFEFAPHDLGQYPKANGQVYGGGETSEENQMPVEECGNMLILVGAIARADGNADYAEQYWPLLTQWKNYLLKEGLDPGNQLCTDDFAGHLAHNTNLSMKAIMAVGAYARMAETLGKTDEAKAARAEAARAEAERMASEWQKMADDGDHYRLTFDRPGTWSQKYNLVWDKLLDLNLFPDEVAAKEVAYYKTKLNAYGLPLDNRADYTKLDWIFWSATLAEDREDFDAILEPTYRWIGTTRQRVPMTDWYDTISSDRVGFTARSVVGGLFIKMLDDEATWSKWVDRADDGK